MNSSAGYTIKTHSFYYLFPSCIVDIYENKIKSVNILILLFYSTVRAIALLLASEGALTKMLKLYFKIFKTLYFLNPQTDLLCTGYDYRCWSKILFTTIHTSAYDLEVKDRELEMLF